MIGSNHPKHLSSSKFKLMNQRYQVGFLYDECNGSAALSGSVGCELYRSEIVAGGLSTRCISIICVCGCVGVCVCMSMCLSVPPDISNELDLWNRVEGKHSVRKIPLDPPPSLELDELGNPFLLNYFPFVLFFSMPVTFAIYIHCFLALRLNRIFPGSTVIPWAHFTIKWR